MMGGFSIAMLGFPHVGIFKVKSCGGLMGDTMGTLTMGTKKTGPNLDELHGIDLGVCLCDICDFQKQFVLQEYLWMLARGMSTIHDLPPIASFSQSKHRIKPSNMNVRTSSRDLQTSIDMGDSIRTWP